jgi:hypothetical protein
MNRALLLLLCAGLTLPLSSNGNAHSTANLFFGEFGATEYTGSVAVSGGVFSRTQFASSATEKSHAGEASVQGSLDNGSQFSSYGYMYPGEGGPEMRLQVEVSPGEGNYGFASVHAYNQGYFQYPDCRPGSRPNTALFTLYISQWQEIYGPAVGFSATEDGYEMHTDYSFAFSYAKYTPVAPGGPPQGAVSEWIPIPILSGWASSDGSGETALNTSVLDSVSPYHDFGAMANLSLGPLEDGAWYVYKFEGSVQTEVKYVPDSGATGAMLLVGLGILFCAGNSLRKSSLVPAKASPL